MKRKLLLAEGFLVLLFLLTASPAPAANVMFILDGSNSMWGQVDGKAKIETAREVLISMLKELPEGTNVGLMAYGLRSKEDCTDVETLAPISANDPAKLSKLINAIKPKGMTLLSYSLEQSLAAFKEQKGKNNTVVLVSDGKETCGGDPCKAAKKLASAGLNLKVHVVGFDVKKQVRAELECIAKAGGGKYFHAESTEGFKNVFAEVKKEVVAPESPPPPKPKAEIYFKDDFDGDDLKPHWNVLHQNLDNYIIENGELLVINSKAGNLAKDTVENLFVLKEPLPKGGWIITASFKVDFQTKKESVLLGIYQNKDNFIILHTAPSDYRSAGKFASVDIDFVKCTKGKISKFRKELWTVYSKGSKDKRSFSQAAKDFPQPLLLRLKKQGRSYYGSAQFAGAKKPKWIELEKLTVLRAKGNLAMGLYQAGDTKGETTMTVDWVKIEAVK